MVDTEKSTKELLGELLSGETRLVRSACSAIIKMSQDEERIREFIPYLTEIKAKTANLEMGGGLAQNKRFVQKVIQVIEYYKSGRGCSCQLFGQDDNPEKYDTIELKEQVKYQDKCIHIYYIVECRKCHQKYKVSEELYHYVWWDWQKI